MVQKERRGTRDIVTDVRFGKFAEFGGVPIATEVLQYRDGRLVFKEQYVDVRVNEPIPDATFDPTKWVAAQPKQRHQPIADSRQPTGYVIARASSVRLWIEMARSVASLRLTVRRLRCFRLQPTDQLSQLRRPRQQLRRR